jgi:hypothetical protein
MVDFARRTQWNLIIPLTDHRASVNDGVFSHGHPAISATQSTLRFDGGWRTRATWGETWFGYTGNFLRT